MDERWIWRMGQGGLVEAVLEGVRLGVGDSDVQQVEQNEAIEVKYIFTPANLSYYHSTQLIDFLNNHTMELPSPFYIAGAARSNAFIWLVLFTSYPH